MQQQLVPAVGAGGGIHPFMYVIAGLFAITAYRPEIPVEAVSNALYDGFAGAVASAFQRTVPLIIGIIACILIKWFNLIDAFLERCCCCSRRQMEEDKECFVKMVP